MSNVRSATLLRCRMGLVTDREMARHRLRRVPYIGVPRAMDSGSYKVHPLCERGGKHGRFSGHISTLSERVDTLLKPMPK